MRPHIPLTPARPFGLLGAWAGLDGTGMVEHESPDEITSDGPATAPFLAGDWPNATGSACVVPFIKGGGGPARAPGRGHEERILRRIYLKWQPSALETAGRNGGIAELSHRGCPVVPPLCCAVLSRWRSDR
jgi:hypothetical protein